MIENNQSRPLSKRQTVQTHDESSTRSSSTGTDGPMTIKTVAKPNPQTVVADEPDGHKSRLKSIGGSQSDHWNNTLTNQAVQTLWLKNSPEERDRQVKATVAALMGIEPKDELEGMMAAQLIAAHNAAMECFRRAMINEQTFEGRSENLAQANKLSRTFATLLEALNRHRGKGQQKVTVEHVHVYEGGQAIVGNVEHPGGRSNAKLEDQPHALAHTPGGATLVGAWIPSGSSGAHGHTRACGRRSGPGNRRPH
jgi:hypothetical protein